MTFRFSARRAARCSFRERDILVLASYTVYAAIYGYIYIYICMYVYMCVCVSLHVRPSDPIMVCTGLHVI